MKIVQLGNSGLKVSEVCLGTMKERGVRERVVLAMKVYSDRGPGPNDGGLSRYHILNEVDESLRRLQTDVIDLYQTHRWYTEAPLEETARVFQQTLLHQPGA